MDKKNGIGCRNTDDDADFIHKHYSYNSLKLAVVKHQFSSGKDKLNQDIRNGGRCFNGNEPPRKFFCIVRNPWERAVSSWKFTFAPQISFKKFLSIPFNKLNKFQYKHSIPQYDYISDYKGKIDYLDHIGKIEDIQHSFDYICNTLNINFCDLKYDFPHLRKTKHKHYTEYYNDETKKMVAEKYGKDIECFGYKFL